MELPDTARNTLIKDGYRQSNVIKTDRITRSSAEKAKIRQKHSLSGNAVSF